MLSVFLVNPYPFNLCMSLFIITDDMAFSAELTTNGSGLAVAMNHTFVIVYQIKMFTSIPTSLRV